MCVLEKAERPWGHWEVLFVGDGYKVKRILVKAGKRLSLQSHAKRSEYWVVAKGRANVIIGTKTFDVGTEDSVFVPMGEKHRLENTSDTDLEIVEVQYGPYLEENDIIRYEDDYGRK